MNKAIRVLKDLSPAKRFQIARVYEKAAEDLDRHSVAYQERCTCEALCSVMGVGFFGSEELYEVVLYGLIHDRATGFVWWDDYFDREDRTRNKQERILLLLFTAQFVRSL